MMLKSKIPEPHPKISGLWQESEMAFGDSSVPYFRM